MHGAVNRHIQRQPLASLRHTARVAVIRHLVAPAARDSACMGACRPLWGLGWGGLGSNAARQCVGKHADAGAAAIERWKARANDGVQVADECASALVSMYIRKVRIYLQQDGHVQRTRQAPAG